ncbi:MAG: WecB/TagA/CpsF family glycosyltransferase [Caldilineaceae bacterium]|nr:WecB/TagA/CpsF family glycosyltransferase [Caldilineaceae bacterium]
MTILGVRVDCVDFVQTLAHLDSWLGDNSAGTRWDTASSKQSPNSQFPNPHSSTHQICTVNPEFIMHARREPAFAAVLQQADLCVPDGIGVLWAARRQGVSLPERVTGSDGIYRICERAARRGWRVFLLGAAPGVADMAAAQLQKLYPTLQVVGTQSGSPADADWPAIQALLNATRPDILFVAYGHPRQDLWIAQHREELSARVALGVGGAFDFVAGVATRAPRPLQRLGLEWLHRLVTQPWRWRRMLVLPMFVWLVLFEHQSHLHNKREIP